MRKIVSYLFCLALIVVNFQNPIDAQTVIAQETTFDNDYVQTIDFSSFDQNLVGDEYYQMLKTGVLNTNKFALTTWFNEKKNLDEDTGKYFDLKKAANTNVPEYVYRFPAAQAFGIAISLKTGVYDESLIGVNKEEAKEIAIKLATSVAYGHKENGGNYLSWGDDWQAAHWAFYAGYAAWLLWDDLNEEEQTLIKNMMIYEANRFNNMNPVFWKTENGKELYDGDSKIEEDAWNGEFMNLAVQMFPKHENNAVWKYRSTQYQLAAFATPSMNESDEIIHGKPAKEWVSGYNVNDDGTVINHGIVHPTYNAASTGVNMSIVNTLLHKKLPISAKYNLDTLYKGLTEVDFKVEDGYKEPGGTIYRDGSYEIYCPQGNDWGGEIYDVYFNIDTSAYAYGYGKDADGWAKLHLQKVLDQQARHADGHTYANNTENSYAGKEEAVTTRFGCAFMTYWLHLQEPVEFDNETITYPHDELPEIDANQQRLFASESIYVRDGSNSDKSYYPTDVMEVKKDGPGYTRESFVKFDLSQVTQIPDKAEVFLPVVSTGDLVESRGIVNKVELILEDQWSEETLTYNTRPKTSEVVLASWVPNKEGLKIDITKYAKEAYHSDKKLSLRIYSDTLVSGNTFTFYGSVRQADPNYRPQILLTYGNEANISLIGDETQDLFNDFSYSLEGTNISSYNDYQLVCEYDANKVKFKNIDSLSNGVTIASINETYKGKTVINLEDSKNNRNQTNLAKLQFQPLAEGNANIRTTLLNNGNVVATFDKPLSITKRALSGNFVSYSKDDLVSTSTKDTTVRIGSSAGDNSARNELDIKTYGNNNNTRQVFMQFTLPTADELQDVEQIKINLYADRAPSGGNTIRVDYLSDSSWNEATLDWNSKPASTVGNDGAAANIPPKSNNTLFEGLIAEAGMIEIDVSDKVKELVNNGQTVMPLYIYGSQHSNGSVVIRSKEHNNTATRPTMTTTYAKKGDVSLSIVPNQSDINRLDTISFDVLSQNVKEINNAEVDINFSDTLQFEDITAINQGVNVEVIGVSKNTVRVKLTNNAIRTLDDSMDMSLFEMKFTTLASGKANVQVVANNDSNTTIQSDEEISVTPISNSDVTFTLQGENTLKNNVGTKLNATFTSFIPNVPYRIVLDYNMDNIKLNDIFSTNQNMMISPVIENGKVIAYDLVVKESIKKYTLEFEFEAITAFQINQDVKITLLDDVKSVSNTHAYQYKHDAGLTNKDALQNLYAQCINLTQGNYTNDSWQSFQSALAQAKTVLNDEFTTQQEIDDTFVLLNTAKNNLRVNAIDKPDNGQGDQTIDGTPKAPNTGDTHSTNANLFTLLIAGSLIAIMLIRMAKKKKSNAI